MSLYLTSLVLLVAFTVLGAFDATWFHIVKHRLFDQGAARLV